MNGVCVECSFSRSPGFSPLRGYQRAPKGRRTRRVFLRARAISLPLPSPASTANVLLSEYGKVLDYFVNALQTHLSENLSIYKGSAKRLTLED